MSGKRTAPDTTARGYSGPRLYRVIWYARERALTVAAPTREAAMVAAAEAWDVRWQDLEFYDRVKVARV